MDRRQAVPEQPRLLRHGAPRPLAPQPRPEREAGRARKRRRTGLVARATTTLERPPQGNFLTRVSTDDYDEAYYQLEMEKGYCVIGKADRYSPALLQQRATETPSAFLAVVGRAAEMTLSLGGFFARLALDNWNSQSENPERVKLRAKQLRELLVKLGPAFVKAGQVLASRPDIVREDYMNELCILQDDVPSFSDVQAFQIMEEDIGRPLGEVFSSISERPIAAASLGQVYKAVLRETGEQVAVKVQRPGVAPLILKDLYIFRSLARFINPVAKARLGCNSELILDEFGEKLLEELDYLQEARNLQDFGANFAGDPKVKIPWVRRELCGARVLVMEWVDGLRCTDPQGILSSGINVDDFIRCGVVSGLRQLLEFGLFHGDPHPGNIFALADGRIAYVDFGNVAELSQANKAVLIDAVVHAVNEDYFEMARDFIKLGFLAPGTDVAPIVPALENIWADSLGRSLADFNFRTVTSKFNELVYQYPIRIPERYALVIRSLLTQEGICMRLQPDFHFLEVAYPYIARRLLTDEDPALRQRLFQVLFQDGKLQWRRLTNLIGLAREGSGGLDLSDTVSSGLRVLLLDPKLRSEVLKALTDENRLHIDEVRQILALVGDDVNPQRVVQETVGMLPGLSRRMLQQWSDRVLAS